MLGLNSNKETLSFKNFKNIIDEASRFKDFQSIVLDLQNEPLLDTDLERKITYIKSKRKDVFVGITTNGVCLSSERMSNLISAGIDKVVVSLNAVNSAEFNEIVKTAKFSRILGNLQQSLSVEGANKIVKLSFGITNKNRTSLKYFIKFFDDIGVNYRYFCMNSRIDTINDKSLISKDIRKLVSFPNSLHKECVRYTKICQIPMYSLTIKLDGTVVICCEDWKESKVLGNVLDSSIQEVWNSHKLKEVREELFTNAKLPRIPCGECGSIRHLPYPTFESSNDISFYETGVGFTKDVVDNCTNIIPIYKNQRWWFKNILTGSVIATSQSEIALFEYDPKGYLSNNEKISRLNVEPNCFVPITNLSINGFRSSGKYFPELNEILLHDNSCLEDSKTIDFTIGNSASGVELLLQGRYLENNRIKVTQLQSLELIKLMLWSYGWQQKNAQ